MEVINQVGAVGQSDEQSLLRGLGQAPRHRC